MPHWGKICFFTHQRLQTFRKSGSIEHHKSSSIAAISHEGKSFRREKISIIVSQRHFGRPMRLCTSGCQTIIFLIQRWTGNVAKYCARFQWCRKQISDHDLDAVCEVKPRTHQFQMSRISWNGSPQSILQGGPTTDRRSRRYATSILRKSLRYTVRCQAAKQASWNELAAGGAAPTQLHSDQARPTFGQGWQRDAAQSSHQTFQQELRNHLDPAR